jgi:hypothetical protein
VSVGVAFERCCPDARSKAPGVKPPLGRHAPYARSCSPSRRRSPTGRSRSSHRNKSPHGSYRDYYTSQTQAKVAEVCAADLDAFGYTF